MRVLALDYGEKRIGIAVSDPLGWTAQGLETYTRVNMADDMKHIGELLEKYAPCELLMGLPKNMNGSLGFSAERVMEFAKKISKHIGVEPVFWDERLSTAAAERMLIDADISRKKRGKVIDKLAAVNILQSYLDSKGGTLSH